MSSQTFELPKKCQPVPVLISFSDCWWDLSMVHNVEQRTTCGNVVSPRLHELIQSSSPGFLLSVTTKISRTSHQLLEEEEFILHQRQLRKAKICTILLMLSVVKIQSIHVKPGQTHRNTQLFFKSFRALQNSGPYLHPPPVPPPLWHLQLFTLSWCTYMFKLQPVVVG